MNWILSLLARDSRFADAALAVVIYCVLWLSAGFSKCLAAFLGAALFFVGREIIYTLDPAAKHVQVQWTEDNTKSVAIPIAIVAAFALLGQWLGLG